MSKKNKLFNNSSALTANSHHQVRRLKYLLLLVLLLALIIIISESSWLAEPEAIRSFVIKFGFWAPVMIILLQMFQAMISIIPSQVTTIVAGFLFGPVLGLVYSLIGATIGSSILFWISKKYGQKLALKFFQPIEILHFQALFKQKKHYALLLARVAPIFPNDLVSFMAGLTKISFIQFSLVSSVGFIAQMVILTLFGSKLAEGRFSLELVIISILVGLLLVMVLFKKKLKAMIIKDLHQVEKDLKKVKVVF